jgi:hypothetical protein
MKEQHGLTVIGETVVGGREVTEGNRGRFPSVRKRRGPSRRRAALYPSVR